MTDAYAQLRVTRHLDSDFRSNVTIITPSSINISEDNNLVRVAGNIGAIEGSFLARYVAFVGIEIQGFSDIITQIEIDFNELELGVEKPVISFQIVTDNNESFTSDRELSDFRFILNSEDFLLSHRGRSRGETYKGQKVSAFRIFFSRSKNSPNDTKALNFRFELDLGKISFN